MTRIVGAFVVLVVGLGLPLLVALTATDDDAVWGLVGTGVAVALTAVPVRLVGAVADLARRPRGPRVLRTPWGEQAPGARYRLSLTLGTLLVCGGILLGLGAVVARAATPLLHGRLDESALLLLVAGPVWLGLLGSSVLNVATGEVHRGGVWLTPVGVVHRSWTDETVVQWVDVRGVAPGPGLAIEVLGPAVRSLDDSALSRHDRAALAAEIDRRVQARAAR